MPALVHRPVLSPERELDKIISLEQVEEVSTLSPDSIKRHHADKLIKLSPRRFGMRLRDALFFDALKSERRRPRGMTPSSRLPAAASIGDVMRNVIDKSEEHQAPIYPAGFRLGEAVAEVRELEQRIQAAEGNACLLAMDQGDALEKIKRSVGRGNWLPFLRACGMPQRTAQVRLRLAANRSVIEAANAQTSAHLSIDAAQKLIGAKKPEPPAAEPVHPLLAVWERLSLEERKAGLKAIDPIELRVALPESFFETLNHNLARLRPTKPKSKYSTASLSQALCLPESPTTH